MKRIFCVLAIGLFCLNLCGCLGGVIVGAAAGAAGGYAVSRDTVQAESDMPYDRIWNNVLSAVNLRGKVKQQDTKRGHIEAEVESSRVWIQLTRLTRSATRIRIAARKSYFPNLKLAEELLTKVLEPAN